MKQRTKEWHDARKGIFTGSEIWKLFVSGRKKDDLFGDTAMTYIKEKAIEKLTGFRQSITTYAMERGTRYEPIAISLYESVLDRKVQECGFYTYKGIIGGSPDGIIKGGGILEVKCPDNPKIHLDYMLSEDLFDTEKKYYYQVQCNMLVTGSDFCHFVSYHPETKPINLHMELIKRDDKVIEEMLYLASLANEKRDQIIEQILSRTTYEETRDIEQLLQLTDFL